MTCSNNSEILKTYKHHGKTRSSSPCTFRPECRTVLHFLKSMMIRWSSWCWGGCHCIRFPVSGPALWRCNRWRCHSAMKDFHFGWVSFHQWKRLLKYDEGISQILLRCLTLVQKVVEDLVEHVGKVSSLQLQSRVIPAIEDIPIKNFHAWLKDWACVAEPATQTEKWLKICRLQ